MPPVEPLSTELFELELLGGAMERRYRKARPEVEAMPWGTLDLRGESESTLLEARTYRFMGHSMSDAVSGTYRTKAELEEWQQRDPIVLLRVQMEKKGELTEDALHKLDDEIKAQVQDAIDFAEKSPEPPPEALFDLLAP